MSAPDQVDRCSRWSGDDEGDSIGSWCVEMFCVLLYLCGYPTCPNDGRMLVVSLLMAGFDDEQNTIHLSTRNEGVCHAGMVFRSIHSP